MKTTCLIETLDLPKFLFTFLLRTYKKPHMHLTYLIYLIASHFDWEEAGEPAFRDPNEGREGYLISEYYRETMKLLKELLKVRR